MVENEAGDYHYNNIGSTMYLTKNGVKTHEFAYGTYGELTKGGYGEVRFMYNGRLGVMTDSNGLYYMRARYYNPEIRRFINQDIITGSIENSQSLNRYAYCQGNPVNYLDPFGLSPQSFGSWAGHTVLNLLSFVPVFGNAADAFNAIWYAYEGNYAEAIACAVGAIPFIGNLATGFNIGSKVVKGCNIAANGGKAAIGFYNGVQNVMNIDHMIRTGTGRWYDYLGQGVQFGLNMFVSAIGVNGAWNGISNLVGELNYKKMQGLAEEVSWKDIDGGAELKKWLGEGGGIIKPEGVMFEGTIYRSVLKQYNPLEMSKYTINSNHRYTEQGIPGLYFSSSEKIVKAELANYDIYDFSARRMYSYDVKLTNLLDVSNPSVRYQLGISLDSIVGETYDITHFVGRYAYSNGYSGIIAPSARADGGINIILFGVEEVR